MIPPFFRVQSLGATTSTNEDVKKVAELGEAEGYVLKARQQTSGKGRHGRVWESPEGNLYVSILLRPECSLQVAGLYSFVAALAVYDALQHMVPSANIQLKWPNDVLVEGKKISGILLETSPTADGTLDWLVIGIGLNIAHSPTQTLYPTTSLAEQGLMAEVDDVLEALLNALDHWRLTLKHDGFRPVRRAWLASAKAGEMCVRLPNGEKQGFFAGVDDIGRLILRLADGSEQFIETGDVFFKGG